MQVVSGQAHLSFRRSGLHIASARNSFQRSAHVRPRASLQQKCEDGVEPQRVSDANSQLATNRRHALGVIAGSALALTAAALDVAVPPPVLAALKDYNLLDPDAAVEEVSVQLGTEDGQYVFIPNTLEFTAGKIYKLKLRNPSISTHYFTPYEFAQKVFSILVLAGDPAVEVKGAISEVALKAGASATWIFIPIKPGKYPVRCTVKGHDGMVGTLIIKRAAA